MSVKEIERGFLSAEGRLDAVGSRNGRSWSRVAPWIIVGASALIAFGPLLIAYGRQLWDAEHYRFFPMVLAAAAWLAWKRYESPVTPSGVRSAALRSVLWGTAFLSAVVTVLADSPFGSAVSLLLLMLAGLYEWGGATVLRQFLPVWAVLLLILRLPFGWDQRMIVSMQQSATGWASGILDVAKIRHMVDGVVIRLPERDFFVDEACSGVHSLFATLAFVAVYSVVLRRGLLRFVPLFAAAILWVLVGNAVRVLTVVFLSTRYDLPVVEGLGHELVGIAIFAAVIGLVMSTDRLILFFYPQAESLPGPHAVPEREGAVPTFSRGRTGPVIVAGLFAVVASLVFVLPSAATPRALSPYASSEGLRPVPKDALPQNWEGWQLVDFQVRERAKDDLAGEISRIWFYQKGRLTAAISIDGPFDAWHDTELCYIGLGYTTQSEADLPSPNDGAAQGAFTELSISGSGGRHGYVLFMAYSEDGKPLRPPISRNASVARLVAAWKDRIAGRPSGDVAYGRVFQVQLFAEGGLNFTDVERAELQGLFHQMRSEIADRAASYANTEAGPGDAT